EMRATLKRALDESFVTGFRRVMMVAAVLALLSSFVAGRLIEGKRKE
ncbi:MAG: Drug resistance transporter, EmrB/QacA subfamily, partial [Pedosphaera sp.]|nr:Drug resistance transporter, EmrB/QacA subfamily [Pedosphaera sp.]